MVNDEIAELSSVRVSAIPFNRTWPGKQRAISQSEIAYVLRTESLEPIRLSVKSEKLIEKVKIRPASKNIHFDTTAYTVSFLLQAHGQYVLEINGDHHAIHIFFDEPESYQTKQVTHSFVSGEHRLGFLELNDNDSIYIGKGATLYANIFAIGKRNIKIFGHGTLNGSCEIRTRKNGDVGWDGEKHFSKEKLHTIGCLRFIDCQNISIDGITVTDSSSYAVCAYASRDICVANVKVVGHWKYNNDGIDLFNCSNAIIKNSFVRSFDDSICIKGISAFSDRNCERITVDNCVLWCGWGKTLEIGLATAAKKIREITFSNCDLIHNQITCISIANGQFADISDVLYKNITVEYEYCDMPVYQNSDDQIYKGNSDYLPSLLVITDNRRNWQGNCSAEDESRSVENIAFENIRVLCNNDIKPRICIVSANKHGRFKNIMLRSVSVNGKLLKNIDLLSKEENNVLSISRKLN